MSFSNINIGKKVDNFETSEIFNAYGRVDIEMGENEQGQSYTISYPNIPDDQVSGRILTVQIPMCTDTALAQTAARRIYLELTDKNSTSFQYAPMKAYGALADPSIEFGDSVDVNGYHSGFYVRATTFGRLMKQDLISPSDEELDHEYPYEDAQQREIVRTNKEFKAGLYVNAQAIVAEVSARQAGDSQLSSKIEQTASQIRAEVVSKEGGNTNSFGWKLLATEFGLYANGQKVFWVNRNGANIKGTLQVGTNVGSTNGFVISANAIYKNISSYGATPTTGVYIGTDGIQLGQNFKVNNLGQVTASNLNITGGTISIRDSSNNVAFSVSQFGAVTAKNLTLNGGSININDVFRVSSTGAVSASNLTITGGSISINNAFQVSSAGAVTASNLSINGGSISINNGQFAVDSDGNVIAKSIKLYGDIQMYNQWGGNYQNISADLLAQYAVDGYNAKGEIDDNGYTWSTGAGYGYNYNSATTEGGDYPNYFKCGTLQVPNNFTFLGSSITKQYMVVNNVTYPVLMWGNPY